MPTLTPSLIITESLAVIQIHTLGRQRGALARITM